MDTTDRQTDTHSEECLWGRAVTTPSRRSVVSVGCRNQAQRQVRPARGTHNPPVSQLTSSGLLSDPAWSRHGHGHGTVTFSDPPDLGHSLTTTTKPAGRVTVPPGWTESPQDGSSVVVVVTAHRCMQSVSQSKGNRFFLRHRPNHTARSQNTDVRTAKRETLHRRVKGRQKKNRKERTPVRLSPW